MRRYDWRYSRPVGCLLCVCLVLALAWLIRLVSGPPAVGAEAQVRLIERRSLRSPGEIAEIYDEGQGFPYAVTKRDGELYTYILQPQLLEGEKRHRFTGGSCWRETPGDLPWGCCIGPFFQFEISNGNSVQVQWMYVLVKNSDPTVSAGRLSVTASLGTGDTAYTRTWSARAERRDPDYLSFRLELRAGSDRAHTLFSAIYNGVGAEDTAASAEVIWMDGDENEVSSLQFDMVRQAKEEGSETNGA